MHLFRKKSITSMLAEKNAAGTTLKKELGVFDLTMLGIGCVVGTGIFVLTGVAAAQHAGPGLILSFILAGIICAFCALCYAEFASMVPVSGSAYTYSYATFGELVAWILGWDLMLEYGFAASMVASGWSGYFQGLAAGFGIALPHAISSAFDPKAGTYVDVPAVLIVLLLTFIVSRGSKESSRLNSIMVIVKIAVIALFVVVGAFYVKPGNWTPFMPFGFSGVVTGAATAFLSYLGFDAVATAAEEVRNPQKDLPRGILWSLAICSLLYVLVTAVLTGIVPYSQLNVKNPVAFALQYIDQNWAAGFISLGAIVGITTVLFVLLFGQSRLLYAIGRDGLLPGKLARLHPRTGVPSVSIWTTGIAVAVLAGLIPLGRLADLVSIGTLFAFITVSLGVVILRRTRPDLPRSFKVPLVPWIPLLAVLTCGYLLTSLPRITWIAFLVWMIFGLLVYVLYGYRHSELSGSAGRQQGN
ncbi:MAG: amino acid permease [Paenibacillus macerans]|uniref:Amino acid permease n=1 Tax=Paenibacillus macerans TaxID=44252 RepID=A0A090Y8A6_PAEMA|nr:amino acid permease [Paenibacillus macerans]KFM94699.1 amino acid permease family protein [Paenibacillus macerans]MBS5912571.1 amino acid permease [Paenibacillus macerans]MCY7558633.1 amino acid permease [Paenibacillus macerans]MDU7475459.1 amino acid permease [Paenibacillus macerans]MEC0139246.1 amino acid permease [Paenibacillus macerans]